eukprot:scaffold54510_cov69-Phaeocystis_antarctica.AAC.6
MTRTLVLVPTSRSKPRVGAKLNRITTSWLSMDGPARCPSNSGELPTTAHDGRTSPWTRLEAASGTWARESRFTKQPAPVRCDRSLFTICDAISVKRRVLACALAVAVATVHREAQAVREARQRSTSSRWR